MTTPDYVPYLAYCWVCQQHTPDRPTGCGPHCLDEDTHADDISHQE